MVQLVVSEHSRFGRDCVLIPRTLWVEFGGVDRFGDSLEFHFEVNVRSLPKFRSISVVFRIVVGFLEEIWPELISSQ